MSITAQSMVPQKKRFTKASNQLREGSTRSSSALILLITMEYGMALQETGSLPVSLHVSKMESDRYLVTKERLQKRQRTAIRGWQTNLDTSKEDVLGYRNVSRWVHRVQRMERSFKGRCSTILDGWDSPVMAVAEASLEFGFGIARAMRDSRILTCDGVDGTSETTMRTPLRVADLALPARVRLHKMAS